MDHISQKIELDIPPSDFESIQLQQTSIVVELDDDDLCEEDVRKHSLKHIWQPFFIVLGSCSNF